jgi:hypothetical protein
MFVFLEICEKAPKNQRKIFVCKASSKVVLKQKSTKNKGFLSQTSVPKVAYYTDVYKTDILLFLKKNWRTGVTPMEQHLCKILEFKNLGPKQIQKPSTPHVC